MERCVSQELINAWSFYIDLVVFLVVMRKKDLIGGSLILSVLCKQALSVDIQFECYRNLVLHYISYGGWKAVLKPRNAGQLTGHHIRASREAPTVRYSTHI